MQNEIQRCWILFLQRINMWSRHSTPSYRYIQSASARCWVVSDSLRPHGLYSPWNSPGQNPGVGSISLLQGIFPTQGSNPGLSHCRRILYQPSHQGNLLYIQEAWKNVATKKCTQMFTVALLKWPNPELTQISNRQMRCIHTTEYYPAIKGNGVPIQHEWTLKTCCWGKEAHHEWTDTIPCIWNV